MSAFFEKSSMAWLRRQYKTVKYSIFDGYGAKSYSQEGEDILLRRIFERNAQGFYIDVGAHHPKRFSNTYFFYKKGWRGINIDPSPETIRLFNRYRPKDINLEIGVSDKSGKMAYFVFDEPALNSFDERLSLERAENTRYQIVAKRSVNVDRLDSILDKYLPQGMIIDFMSIDAEGHDEHVVRSNDWTRYRPRCLLVEVVGEDLAGIMDSPLHQFLVAFDYKLFAKTLNTIFYLDCKKT